MRRLGIVAAAAILGGGIGSGVDLEETLDRAARRSKNRKIRANPRPLNFSQELKDHYGEGYVNGKTRNKPCLCGSGKKLKKCCANKFLTKG